MASLSCCVRNTPEKDLLPAAVGSVGTNASGGAPSRCSQFIPLSCSISGFSTCVYSGPSAISLSPYAPYPSADHLASVPSTNRLSGRALLLQALSGHIGYQTVAYHLR